MTEEDFKRILDGYFAPPEKRRKLVMEEIQEISSRLNALIDIPLISEKREQSILMKIVLKVDNFLYDNLPNELYDTIRSADQGIDDDEAKRLITRLTRLANEKIDIPYIPEIAEQVALKYIIGVVINSARKNWDFLSASRATENDLIASVA